MMTTAPEVKKSTFESNRLIAALPDAELVHWLPWLEWVEMPLGKVLYESGKTQSVRSR